MNTQDKFDLFNEGLHSEHRALEFKKQLKENPALSEEFRKYIETGQIADRELYSPLLSEKDDPIIDSLTLEEKLKIDEDVVEYYRNRKNDNEENVRIFKEKIVKITRGSSNRELIKRIHPIYKIAAVLIPGTLIFLSLIWIFFQAGKGSSPAAIFDQFYNPSGDRVLNSSVKYDITLQKAFIAFRNADLAEASSNLDQISTEYDPYFKYSILKGLISLEKGENEKAISLFKTAMDHSTSDTRYIAKWYLGLSYLKANMKDQAVSIFSDLSQDRNPYRKQAKKILNKLN